LTAFVSRFLFFSLFLIVDITIVDNVDVLSEADRLLAALSTTGLCVVFFVVKRQSARFGCRFVVCSIVQVLNYETIHLFLIFRIMY
jgi:hypothetical protein